MFFFYLQTCVIYLCVLLFYFEGWVKAGAGGELCVCVVCVFVCLCWEGGWVFFFYRELQYNTPRPTGIIRYSGGF